MFLATLNVSSQHINEPYLYLYAKEKLQVFLKNP